MPELTTIPAAELAELRERLARLARDKAQLQLVALLMNRLGELPGPEETVAGLLQFVMEVLGGLNVALFYRVDEQVHYVDVLGKRAVVAEIEDGLVRQVFETRQFVSAERDFGRTAMTTTGSMRAATWAMPLLVGAELVGVLRIDDLPVAGGELREEVRTFLRYASLVLKNAISGETRLQAAFDQVSQANRQLQRAKDELERRVADRTAELIAANERLRLELGERARAEAALAARHSTLSGIIEGTDAPIFSLDTEYRYVAFNRSHAAAMRALYGAEIEPGRCMLDYMTVAGDAERARGNLDRALAGEQLVESAYSGEERRTRTCFEVSHHPVRSDDGRVVGVAVFARDVTERRRGEEERRTNLWISESLDRVNRAIQGTQDLGQMMSDVLDAALAIFECDRAFLLHPCDPEAAAYRVPMERTRPGFPGALAAGAEVPVDVESSRVLAAVRSAPGPLVFDPRSEPPLPGVLRERFLVQSQIAMALHPKRGEPYLFGLHQCSAPRRWRPEEERLFLEIGRRLSDGLTSLLVQAELRESEERYRTIFENSPVGIFRSTFEGRFLVANPALARILGYDSPEAVVDDIRDIGQQVYADPEDRRRLVAEHASLTGVTQHLTRHRRKDGAEFVANQYLRTTRDAAGRPLFLEGILEDITERVRAEEALRDERGLFVGGPTVVFKWQAREGWPVEYVSRNVEGLFGYTAEDLTSGRVPYATVVHPDDLGRVAAEVAAYSQQGAASFEQAYRVVRADGRHRWVHDFTRVARGADGAITHYHGYVLDITARKQAEIELARVNRALRMLSESNQALIHASDEPELLSAVCRTAVEVGGYRLAWVGWAGPAGGPAEGPTVRAGACSGRRRLHLGQRRSCGRPSRRAVLTGLAQVARDVADDPTLAAWREAARQHGCRSMIALPLISEGHTLGALSIYSTEPDAFDPAEVAVLEDLASDLAFGVNALRTRAKRDRAEAALLQSEEKYRTLIQKIQAAVVVHSADTRIVTCNSKAQELLGLTEDQLLGKVAIDPAWRFLRDDGTVMPPAEYPVSQVLATRQPLRGLTVGVHRPPRQDEVWVLVSADPVMDAGEAISQVIVTFIDITQRKRAEAELQQAQKMEALGRLAGGIAHDFNNLLQALLSHAQLLRMAPERVDSDLTELEAQVRRGAALTRQLLLFSRRQEAQREPLDLNEVITALGRLLRRLVRENVALTFELDTAPLMVQADRGQLDQVLMNLAINATDAMPAGGRLSIRTGCDGAMAFFAVQDTGSGIPEAIRSRVFEPLFTTKPVGLGTGLGLSVVREIVSQHGGRIELDSAEGTGTTFRVLLPRSASGEAPGAPPRAAEQACPAGNGQRVLVVEDGAAARVGLRAILGSLRYAAMAVEAAPKPGRCRTDRPSTRCSPT